MRKIVSIIGLLFLLVAFPAAAQDREAVITLERTPCFGTCPVYTVTIYDDGTVVYDGLNYVDVLGQQTIQLPVETVDKMISVFEEAGYFEWEDEYLDQMVTDHPYTLTSVRRAGVTKRINHYHGDSNAPMTLSYLEYWIDRMVGTVQWVGQEPWFPSFVESGAPLISLERQPCYRTCPSYVVTIYEDGTVFYAGFDHVAQTGIRTTTIDVEAVAALMQDMTDAGYQKWSDHYTDQTETDQATVITTLSTEGVTKRIIRYEGDAGAPKALAALENAIDAAVNSAQWVDQAA